MAGKGAYGKLLRVVGRARGLPDAVQPKVDKKTLLKHKGPRTTKKAPEGGHTERHQFDGPGPPQIKHKSANGG